MLFLIFVIVSPYKRRRRFAKSIVNLPIACPRNTKIKSRRAAWFRSQVDTQDVTSTRAGGMYSQSVVFPRLAVIQSAKWKDRNGLWFGFRIIHYAAHNTPSPATAVLHTQLGRDWPHTRTTCTYKRKQEYIYTYMCAYTCVSNNKPNKYKNNCVSP